MTELVKGSSLMLLSTIGVYGISGNSSSESTVSANSLELEAPAEMERLDCGLTPAIAKGSIRKLCPAIGVYAISGNSSSELMSLGSFICLI